MVEIPSLIMRVLTVFDVVARTIRARGETYDRLSGKVEANFSRAAALASIRLDRELHPYEIAVILACVKQARNAGSPEHVDSHLDGVAYEAFAAVLAEGYDEFRAVLSNESKP